VTERLLRSRLHREIVMSDTGPVFNHTLQREIDDLREQACSCLPAGSAIASSPALTRSKSR
jgi:hypothetical protein